MQAIAKLRAARISAQKARLVADQIRGKHVNEAIEILTFSQKKASAIILKLLNSAIANEALCCASQRARESHSEADEQYLYSRTRSLIGD